MLFFRLNVYVGLILSHPIYWILTKRKEKKESQVRLLKSCFSDQSSRYFENQVSLLVNWFWRMAPSRTNFPSPLLPCSSISSLCLIPKSPDLPLAIFWPFSFLGPVVTCSASLIPKLKLDYILKEIFWIFAQFDDLTFPSREWGEGNNLERLEKV